MLYKHGIFYYPTKSYVVEIFLDILYGLAGGQKLSSKMAATMQA